MTQSVTPSSPSNLHIETSDLLYLLNLIKNEVKTEINCHAIGTIQTFDPLTQTCTVLFNYQKVLKKRNATTPAPNQFSDVVIAYPVLIRVPVIILGGGSAYLTFPITTGDTCLLLFCDRDIDGWLESGITTNPPFTTRLHDLSDAVALVGLHSIVKAITNYFTNGVKIGFSGGYLTIDNSGNIIINSPATCTLQGNTVILKGKDYLGSLEIDALGNIAIVGTTINIQDITGKGIFSIDALGNISLQGNSLKMLGVPIPLIIGTLYGPTGTDGRVDVSAQTTTNTGACSMTCSIGPTASLGTNIAEYISNSNNTAFPSPVMSFLVPKGWYYQVTVANVPNNQIMYFTPIGNAL